MKRFIALTVVVATISALLVGCSQRLGDFTLMSTKNVDIGGKYKKLDGRFVGEDSKGMLLGIPLGTPNFKEATDRCIEAGKGDLLSNVVLEYSVWSAIVWGQQKYIVTGDVWIKAGTSELFSPDNKLYELQAGTAGYELVSLSDASDKVKVDRLISSR